MKMSELKLRSILRGVSFVLPALMLAGVATQAVAAEGHVPAPGASPIIDQIREQGELRAGFGMAPPWLGQNPGTNEYFGASYEIGVRVAELLGVKLTMVPAGWDVIIAGLQGSQYELVIAPLFATEKRKAVVDFVNYTAAGTCYMVLKDSAKINDLDDMNQASVTIGTFTGTGTEHGIREKYPNANIESVVQQPGGGHRAEDVLAGRIDAAPFDDALAFVIAAKYDDLKILPGGPEFCVNNSDIPFPIGMAFNKDQPVFAEFLATMAADMQGEVDAAIVKYSAPEYMEQ